jgi:hypothetical protein
MLLDAGGGQLVQPCGQREVTLVCRQPSGFV